MRLPKQPQRGVTDQYRGKGAQKPRRQIAHSEYASDLPAESTVHVPRSKDEVSNKKIEP